MDEGTVKNIKKVFSTTVELTKKKIEAHELWELYILSLISKFGSDIDEMPEESRYAVIQDALIALMVYRQTNRITLSDVEKDRVVWQLLRRPTKRAFVQVMNKLPRFRKKRYHCRHRGVMREHDAIYEYIEEEEHGGRSRGVSAECVDSPEGLSKALEKASGESAD